MLEIIAVILLCSTNSKNAKARGKSGGAAIAYTLGLWFGGEILGFAIGIGANEGEFTPPVYIAALLFAVGGGVASYFIAKRGNLVAQQQPQMYGAPPIHQYNANPGQQPQPTFINQQGQLVPPNPSQFPQPAFTNQQGQPLPPNQAPPQQPQMQPAQVQEQPGTATIVFSAKKVMGQFLVSSATIEINGIPYQADFKKPINILAPAGNVQIVCYLNYLDKSGLAQMHATLAPNQSYQVNYKSPAVVTGSGTLTITQV